MQLDVQFTIRSALLMPGPDVGFRHMITWGNSYQFLITANMFTFLRGCTQVGQEAMEWLRFFASLPLAGTMQREGGGFSCINKRIITHPFTDKEI